MVVFLFLFLKKGNKRLELIGTSEDTTTSHIIYSREFLFLRVCFFLFFYIKQGVEEEEKKKWELKKYNLHANAILVQFSTFLTRYIIINPTELVFSLILSEKKRTLIYCNLHAYII